MKHIVIIPVIPKPEYQGMVMEYVQKLSEELKKQTYFGESIRVHIDSRDKRGGEKNWEWIKKGVPIRLEIGPKDIEAGKVVFSRRDFLPTQKQALSLEELYSNISLFLDEIQRSYYEKAIKYRDAHLYHHVSNFKQMEAFFTPKNEEKPEIHGGFVLGKWCGDPTTEELLAPMKVTIRCLPLNQTGTKGTCIITGREATLDAVFAKSY